jgi:hypothetical protein
MTELFVNVSEFGYHFDQNGIAIIEEKYGAKYMGFWCTQSTPGNWNDVPVDVFYQPNPDTSKGHSEYFGMFIVPNFDEALPDRRPTVLITNAATAFAEPMTGVICEDGEVLISRYRHDYRTKGDRMVDGGRDYVRRSLHPTATVTVVNGNFVIKED